MLKQINEIPIISIELENLLSGICIFDLFIFLYFLLEIFSKFISLSNYEVNDSINFTNLQINFNTIKSFK